MPARKAPTPGRTTRAASRRSLSCSLSRGTAPTLSIPATIDAVLAIRRLSGDVEMKVKKSRTEIDATPIGGRFLNLFRSDYTDYKTPGSINFATEALLAVEFYSAASEDIVFSFDHQTKKETNLGLLIDQTAETIVKRIDREGLLAN